MEEVAKFTVQYPSVSITKRTFPSIFKNAYEISCSVETIKSSFRATGTWPVNRFKVDHDLQTRRGVSKHSTACFR